jgi:hypothetical protein
MTKYSMVIAIPEPVPIAGCMVGEPVQLGTKLSRPGIARLSG